MAESFDYGDDLLDEGEVSSDSGVAELSRLVTMLSQQDIEVERAEAHLKKMKEDRDDLRRRRIPDLMDELNCRTHETRGGLKVTIKRVVKASITDKTRTKAVAWFEEQNLSRMVKNEFTVKLNKGAKITKGDEEHDAAQAVTEALEAVGVEYKKKPGVHHSTLSAFIKERDAAGETTPDELFNVYRYSEAKVG